MKKRRNPAVRTMKRMHTLNDAWITSSLKTPRNDSGLSPPMGKNSCRSEHEKKFRQLSLHATD
jgi:hypothetical protein